MPSGKEKKSLVEELAMRREIYLRNVELVEECAIEAGGDIAIYIFECVAHGASFPELEKRGIPCGRDYFYERYRRYFYLLDKRREL